MVVFEIYCTARNLLLISELVHHRTTVCVVLSLRIKATRLPPFCDFGFKCVHMDEKHGGIILEPVSHVTCPSKL
jgi:hypothetical protein